MRRRLGLTPAALARLLRVRPVEVPRWERGSTIQSALHDLVLRLLRDVPGSLAYLRSLAPRAA